MADKIDILFVDDEPNVLSSIRRMLRSKRGEWNMAFAGSGAEALELFKETCFDVVVSDIRMPNMDGAELLAKIRDQHEGVIRIALSGQVDLTEVIRSMLAVHQYISKPCTAEELIQKVEEALRSRKILTDPALQTLIAEMDGLPVIPEVIQTIQEELSTEEPSIARIAEHITKDIGLVARILKLVNSPYFGLPKQIDSIFQAITLLGLDTIHTLVVSSHFFSLYDGKLIPDFSIERLWEHCCRVSSIAHFLGVCERIDEKSLVHARMAGLLHDVGKLILAHSFPKRYGVVLMLVNDPGMPVHKAERLVFETTHAEVGAYLMGLWGLSGEVVHALGHHHEFNPYDLSPTTLISVANVLDHHCVVINEEYARPRLPAGVLEGEEGKERLKKWLAYLDEHWDGVEVLQDVSVEALVETEAEEE